jgi:hypothetical protein
MVNGGLKATDSSKGAVQAIDAAMEEERKLAAMVCSLENKDECLMCGS